MAKKQKRNLQKLIAKKQQLTQVIQGATISFEETPVIIPAQKVRPAIAAQSTQPATHPLVTTGAGRELRKTAVSIVLIALILTAAIIFDHKTPYFSHFGDWLYKTLRLQA